MARGRHIHVHVTLSPRGAAGAAGAKTKGQEAALLLLEGEELTTVHMAAPAEARVQVVRVVQVVGVVLAGRGLEGGVLGRGEEGLGGGGAHGRGRGGSRTVACLAMELKR